MRTGASQCDRIGLILEERHPGIYQRCAQVVAAVDRDAVAPGNDIVETCEI